MNLGQSIRTGVKWLLVGSMGGEILQFAFGIALARLLVPADFGMIATMQVFTGFVGMLASGGMGQSLIRAKEANADDFNAVFTLQLGMGIAIYLGFFIAAPWIAWYFDNPIYVDLLRVSALSFLLRPLSFARISWLNRKMEFKTRTQVNLITAFIAGICSVLMALSGIGVWSLTLAGILGGLISNALLSYWTPLRLRLNFHLGSMKSHSAFGFKITASEILNHLKTESISLILSKYAGPAFLGLFNKADSLARMPNRLMTPPISQTVFRAMSNVQDDLDQTKYMFYRTITLLTVYVGPCLIGLWWVAEPLIGVLYGHQWQFAVEPLRIMVISGFFRIIFIPCGIVMTAQNRLGQKIIAESVGLVVSVTACVIGLSWGLEGVAWALVASAAIYTTYVYIVTYRIIPTRISDLFKAITPGLMLGVLLFLMLGAIHILIADLKTGVPPLYLGIMVVAGSLSYACIFLFLPIPALRTETARWKVRIGGLVRLGAKRSK